MRCGGGFAHAFEVREGGRVEAGGSVPSEKRFLRLGEGGNEGREVGALL